jgi:hypothetical protein
VTDENFSPPPPPPPNQIPVGTPVPPERSRWPGGQAGAVALAGVPLTGPGRSRSGQRYRLVGTGPDGRYEPACHHRAAGHGQLQHTGVGTDGDAVPGTFASRYATNGWPSHPGSWRVCAHEPRIKPTTAAGSFAANVFCSPVGAQCPPGHRWFEYDDQVGVLAGLRDSAGDMVTTSTPAARTGSNAATPVTASRYTNGVS